MFDPDRVDERVELGTVEERTLYNVTPEQHPCHPHVNDFQARSVNGQPYNAAGRRDGVPIPPNGNVVIRAPFADCGGRFVLHCHILCHEDHAMMAVVDAADQAGARVDFRGAWRPNDAPYDQRTWLLGRARTLMRSGFRG